jgi:type I restriction enzyme S subunit
MEVRPGYRQTEVGVIPQEWDVKPFREIGKLSKGKGLLKEDINCSGAIPAIPYTALYTDYSEVLDYSLIKWFIDDETQSVIVREPCLLLASSSNMEVNTGKASALVGTTPVAIGREVIIFKTSADCKFISYLLSTQFYRKQTLKLARGTTIKHVYPATFQGYRVAVPPLPEQRAIAGVFGDVDALIGALDRLIAKKHDLKQAAMQQLLTGQTRLPSFSGKWEMKRLGAVAPLQRGFDLPNPQLRPGPHPVVYSNGILNHHSKFQVRGPGVVTGRSGTIGKVAYVEEDYWPHNTSLWVTSFKGNSPKFIFYLLNMIGLKRFESGSGVPTLNRNDVHSFTVNMPPTIEEQTAIASVLSDMDSELSALTRRRDKTHHLKQAMMQELLTGRIRLS